MSAVSCNLTTKMHHGRPNTRLLPGINMQQKGVSGPNLVFTASVLVLVTLIGIVQETKSEEYVEPASEKGPFDCMRVMLRGGKAIMKVLSSCSHQVKANSTSTKDFSDKMGCIMKCVMYSVNMTTPNYFVTDDSLLPLLKRFLPNEFMIHEFHSFLITTCGKIAAKIDPSEEKCTTYSDYVVCLQAGFEGFINTSPYCIKKKKKNDESSG